MPPTSNATEEYNGSAWTGGGNLINARTYLGGCGIQTAALATMGFTTGPSALVEEYDGSTWTAGGTAPAANNFNAAGGIQTAAFSCGGESDGTSTN
jgi:hypothetical protein